MQFQADDREFVTSTGSNALGGRRSTRFDGPPEDQTGLRISSRNVEGDPRLFALGDVYDVMWEGGRIDGAEVVRSDAIGDDGVVCFAGLDDSGAPAYVLWTPGFDLQSWYENVGAGARFYTTDQQSQYTHSHVCFAAEVRIDTPYGPVPAGLLRPGHRVLTKDAGPRTIRWVGRRRVVGEAQAAPVHVPAGAFGAVNSLRLSQQHRVLLAAQKADLLFGAHEVFVPAKALVGHAGIRIAPCDWVTYVHLLLDEHHVIHAEGMACESLFVGIASEDLTGKEVCPLPDGEQSAICHASTARPTLSYWESRVLLETDLGGTGDTPVVPS